MTCLPEGLTPLAATLAWLLFVLLTCVGPGLALQRLLRVPLEPAVVLPLGLLACAGGYGASLYFASAWLFPVLMLALDASLLLGWRRPWTRAPGPSLRGAVPSVAGLGLLFAFTQFGLNRCAPDGGFLLDPLERVDTAFHVGVSFELTHDWPPQVPGLAGVPLHYHVAGHLVRAAAMRFAGLHPYDLLTRFDLLFGLIALVLAWRALGHALGVSRWVLACLPWSLVLSDAAFVLAPWAGTTWLAELTGANGLLVLFFGNTLVPALALAFGALVLLARVTACSSEPTTHDAGHARGRTLCLAALLVAGLAFLKLFVLPPLLAGLALACLRARDRRASVALLVPGLVTLAYVLATGPALGTFSAHWDPARLGAQVLALWERTPTRPSPWLLAGATGAWLFLALGVRALGVTRAWRGLLSTQPVRVIVAVWALCGWLARGVQLTADGRFDESVYFSIQSGCVLWLFTLEALHAWWLAAPVHQRAWRALAAGTCLLLALPTSLDFVRRRLATPAEHVPAALLRASRRVAELSRPGDVVWMPSFSRWPPPPLVFVGRRVPYAEYLPYLTQFAPQATLDARLANVRRFFRGGDPGAGEAPAAGTLVYIGGRRTPIEDGLELEAVYAEEGVRLYRLRATPRPQR